MPARNTPVQLLALYANPDSHNAQRHRQTDGRTDDRCTAISDHTVLQYDRLKTNCMHGYRERDAPSVEEIFAMSDDQLFSKINSNSLHILQHYA